MLRPGLSSSSTAVPSKVLVFSFGRPQSWSVVDVEMSIADPKVGDDGCSLVDGRRYLSS